MALFGDARGRGRAYGTGRKGGGMASYKAVQSVEKAFVVLELLNRQPITRLRDLAAGTGLPLLQPTALLRFDASAPPRRCLQSERPENGIVVVVDEFNIFLKNNY